MSEHDPSRQVSSGVQELLRRLRDEGVAEGRVHAERIVQDADTRATWILQQAEDEAARMRSEAHEEAEHLKHAGQEALKVAMRDAVLHLKGALEQRFTHEVRRLVGDEMRKRELLDRMILAVVGQAREQVEAAEAVEILLPRTVVDLEELRRHPGDLENGVLSECVRCVSQSITREGVTFKASESDEGGIHIRLSDEHLSIDLSDRAVADLLLKHLQPRFRALLEGVVR